MLCRFAFAVVLIAFSTLSVLAADPGLDERYTEAIKLDPKNPVPYIHRANAWLRRGEIDKAIMDFTEAITLDPKNATHYARRGDALASKGRFDDAVKDFTEAITFNLHDEGLYTLRGNAWGNKGDFDHAIKDYLEAIRLFPKDVFAYNAIAWLRATCPNERYRDGQKAMVDATTACVLSGWQEAGCIDTLAAAYAETGDFSNAIKWQEKAIALTKTDKQEMQIHLDLYQAGKPFREQPR